MQSRRNWPPPLGLAILLGVAITGTHWWLNRLSTLEQQFVGVWYVVQEEGEGGVAIRVLRLVECLPDRTCRVRSLRRSPAAWDTG
jgi:hypothetical protein